MIKRKSSHASEVWEIKKKKKSQEFLVIENSIP